MGKIIAYFNLCTWSESWYRINTNKIYGTWSAHTIGNCKVKIELVSKHSAYKKQIPQAKENEKKNKTWTRRINYFLVPSRRYQAGKQSNSLHPRPMLLNMLDQKHALHPQALHCLQVSINKQYKTAWHIQQCPRTFYNCTKIKNTEGKRRLIGTCTSAIAWSARVVFPLLSGPNICRESLQFVTKLFAPEYNPENKIYSTKIFFLQSTESHYRYYLMTEID